MSLSPSRIRIHAIWSKKDRSPLLHPTADHLIYKFLEGDFQEMGCTVKIINQMDDPIQVLLLLNPQNLLVEDIKQTIGNSSHLIFPQNLVAKKFSCLTSPALVTTGGNLVDKASLYTETRKERYAKKSLQTKYNEIIKNHGFGMEI